MRSLVLIATAACMTAALPALAQESTEIEPTAQKYKCTSKDAVGDWSMITFTEEANQCTFTVNSDRKISKSSCIEKKTGKNTGTMSGKIVVDKKCTVTANLTLTSGKDSVDVKLDANMTFDQTAFTGLMVRKNDEFVGVAAIRAK